ncbi:hypothetical protein E2493_10120 [Sphingomonas parva]|uniref:Uncharacterized protein n=1 Tax=Sphingomonas parva TaxID=2555898 RepID=A0A4Y8ZQT9_9SPHN|nr:hypothetical protein [Sphingomonas parva]TFI58334.1 hypothetical protein E2493_10120 [Sphingomonas parva]
MANQLTNEALSMLARILTHPAIKLPKFDEVEQGVPKPRLATIREIDIKTNGNKIDAKFSRGNFVVDTTDYPGGIAEVVDRVRRDTLPYPDDTSGGPSAPFKCPLSLKNNKNVYVIFKLTGKNWQFAHNAQPFSIGVEAYKSDCYFDARRVDSAGAVDDGDDPAIKKYGCKVAYFIALGDRAVSGNPPDYVHDFNLHLDLIYSDHNQNATYTPIIVDPDIRFPGGSG